MTRTSCCGVRTAAADAQGAGSVKGDVVGVVGGAGVSAVLEAREPSATYLTTLRPWLLQHFETVAHASGSIGRFRNLILLLSR